MTDYSYISLAVHGQYDGQVKTVYTYPTEPTPAWAATLIDPATITPHFINMRDCYMMWANADGHFFSLITRNPMDQRSGAIMLTLCIADGYSLTGQQIVNTLAHLKRTLIEDDTMMDGAVTRCLESIGIPAQGLRQESWLSNSARPAVAPKGMCYRTYVSGTELESILSFPNQTDYERFQKVIIIPATTSLRPGAGIERITSPVKKVFTVITPDDVKASKTLIADGERLTLTYSKPGFNPRKETVIAGTPSSYVRYAGSAMIIKKAQDCGLSFVRRIKIAVKSAKGGAVNGYTINVNGRPVNTMDPAVEISETDMAPGKTTEISVASNNFRPVKVVKDSQELAAMETLDIVLEPLEQGIVLRLDFGEGRTFEQEIMIERNTPEYRELHSGNFHGFRAHRVATPGGEVYNVDVRAGSRPTAPTFANVTDKSTPTTERKVPVFENVSRGTASVAAGAGAKTEKVEADAPKGGKRDKKEDGRAGSSVFGSKAGVIVGAAAALILLIVALVWLLPGGSDEPKEPEREVTTFSEDPNAIEQAEAEAAKQSEASVQQRVDNAVSQVAPAASEGASDKADYDYLNKETKTWQRDRLTSETGKALINAIASGDIDAFASSPYFAKEGNCANTRARKTAEWVWATKGTGHEKAVREIMKNSVKADGTVDLYNLWDNVSRHQPKKDEANKEPMPKL